jgi:hypothetical protein
MVSMVYDSWISPLALSVQAFHRPASPQGSPSARQKRHQMFLPVSQQGSSNETAGMMMQRLP